MGAGIHYTVLGNEVKSKLTESKPLRYNILSVLEITNYDYRVLRNI